ncbi:MAG: hypothetical protein HQL50_15690, partial [Magnetococcales bacterium]|nr:hypothetical protein [Magnetococcales bacterium]
LDHRLIEHVATLPTHWKMHGAEQKVMLKAAMQHKLPASILKRPKKGFNFPAHLVGTDSLQSLQDTGLFSPSFSLDPKREDITFKSFSFRILTLWFDMFHHYKQSGRWEPIAYG